MLKRPGLDTIPMDIVPTGVSQSTSSSSSVLKQVVTLVKPRGSVGALLMPVLWLVGETLVVMEPLGVGWWADGSSSGELKGSSLHPWHSSWLGGLPCGYHRLGWVYYHVPPSILWSHLWYGWHLWGVSGTRGISSGSDRN